MCFVLMSKEISFVVLSKQITKKRLGRQAVLIVVDVTECYSFTSQPSAEAPRTAASASFISLSKILILPL